MDRSETRDVNLRKGSSGYGSNGVNGAQCEGRGDRSKGGVEGGDCSEVEIAAG